MLRPNAVLSLLVDDVASVHQREEESPRDALRRALRRAQAVVALDWAAILILFVTANRFEPFLEWGLGERTPFTLGILAVAVHSGFRLGQAEKLKAVERTIDDRGLDAAE